MGWHPTFVKVAATSFTDGRNCCLCLLQHLCAKKSELRDARTLVILKPIPEQLPVISPDDVPTIMLDTNVLGNLSAGWFSAPTGKHGRVVAPFWAIYAAKQDWKVNGSVFREPLSIDPDL
jgi:hypothetical protein